MAVASIVPMLIAYMQLMVKKMASREKTTWKDTLPASTDTLNNDNAGNHHRRILHQSLLFRGSSNTLPTRPGVHQYVSNTYHLSQSSSQDIVRVIPKEWTRGCSSRQDTLTILWGKEKVKRASWVSAWGGSHGYTSFQLKPCRRPEGYIGLLSLQCNSIILKSNSFGALFGGCAFGWSTVTYFLPRIWRPTQRLHSQVNNSLNWPGPFLYQVSFVQILRASLDDWRGATGGARLGRIFKGPIWCTLKCQSLNRGVLSHDLIAKQNTFHRFSTMNNPIEELKAIGLSNLGHFAPKLNCQVVKISNVNRWKCNLSDSITMFRI